MIRQETRALSRAEGELVAVSFPGMDVPGLWESEWDLVPGPNGHHTGYMANRMERWVDAARWRDWLMGRASGIVCGVS